MQPSEWIALAALIFTIFSAAAGVVWRASENKNQILHELNKNKDDLEAELVAIRMAAFEEYKILRKEMNEASSLSYREFGESLRAIREKVNEIELWIRDELAKTRHTLTGSMDMRYQIITEQIEGIDERLRMLEIRMGPIP